jgi:hypothetical protein
VTQRRCNAANTGNNSGQRGAENVAEQVNILRRMHPQQNAVHESLQIPSWGIWFKEELVREFHASCVKFALLRGSCH